MLALVKFSSHDCSACEFMAGFDSRMATDMGLEFIDVNMKNLQSYRHYRRILLQQHPLRRELELPTYFLVLDPDGDFHVQGEIVGSMTQENFRQRLEALCSKAASVAGQ